MTETQFHQKLQPPQLHQRLVVPLRPYVDVELFVPFPMTEADWDQFMIVLAAMKPGLVKELAARGVQPRRDRRDRRIQRPESGG